MAKKKTGPAITPTSKDGLPASIPKEGSKTETKQSPPISTPDTTLEQADSGSVPQMEPILGVFQDIYDAWESATDFINGMPDIYFRNVLTIQMNEIDEHEDAEAPLEKKTNEMVDIISVTFNWMRSKGLDDVGIRHAVIRRTSRFADVDAIMAKYNEEYGL